MLFRSITQKVGNVVYADVVGALADYGAFDLWVISNRDSGLINADLALPFAFKYNDGKTVSMGTVAVALNGTSTLPEEVLAIVETVISTMNIVLGELIPGLKIAIITHGVELVKDGTSGKVAELVTDRDGIIIPLRYESDGIKKIISLLHMLIQVYNDASMTLVVDELDTGIFEYLLGELLDILSDTGSGQFIFTAHNLRPLEKLDKKSIIFTTSNPANRYVRIPNLKSNHNLRDCYYRTIMLGGQEEELYSKTNTYAISYALDLAGSGHGE